MSSLAQGSRSSIVFERVNRIETRGVAGRKVARESRDGEQKQCAGHESGGIRGCHTVEQSGHDTTERERRHDSERESRRGQSQAAPHEKPHHVTTVGTDRHADADLLRALRDTERQHAIEPDRREEQRGRGEAAQHHQGGAGLRDVGRD